MINTYLHDFVFNFNCYKNVWQACKREHYNELFSGDKGNVITSSSVTTLQSLINKYKGNINLIKQEVK